MIHPGVHNEGSAHCIHRNLSLGKYLQFSHLVITTFLPGGKLNHLKYLLSPVIDLESLTSFLMRFYLRRTYER